MMAWKGRVAIDEGDSLRVRGYSVEFGVLFWNV